MTLQAIDTDMFSGKWESCRIVVEIRWSPSIIAVTEYAICRESGAHVIWIHSSIEVVHMTSETIGRSSGIAIRVTLQTVHSNVSTSQWECCVVVIEVSRSPAVFCVTDNTVRWEHCCLMVRVSGSIEVIQVAAYTGVRSIYVVSIMTGSTVIGEHSMRSIECVVVIVYVKAGRHPIGIRAVA
jgi:hypothetical protein